MKALLIIDMQVGSFKPYTLRYDTMGVIKRINDLSEYFRKSNNKVIFIQHDGTKEHNFLPGTADWEILPELTIIPSDLIISKTANDSFYKTGLQETLIKSGITELYITGCATDFCVDTTIKSALGKDYKITVIDDGHTTANRPHIGAETIIQYYNWLWADMTPTEYKIRVINSADLVKGFSSS